MVSKPRNFNPASFYHIYNRSIVEKERIFLSGRDYNRFLSVIAFYLYKHKISYSEFERLSPKTQEKYMEEYHANPKGLHVPRVTIISYSLMPNHFHLLAKPNSPEELSKFMADITNSYTRYFNIKNKRTGVFFESTFKAKEVNDNSSILQLTRYIHLNPLLSSKTNPKGLRETLEKYKYSSYQEWLGTRKSPIIDQDSLEPWINLVGGRDKYKEFVEAKINSRSLGVN